MWLALSNDRILRHAVGPQAITTKFLLVLLIQPYMIMILNIIYNHKPSLTCSTYSYPL